MSMTALYPKSATASMGVMRAMSSASTSGFATGKMGIRTKHTLPDLPYDYAELEPYISGAIMEIHHSKHHQAYVTNLNIAEEKIHEAQAKNDLPAQIALQPAQKFNGGGHINHTIFWTNLAPKSQGGGTFGSGKFQDHLIKDFGSLEVFQKTFATQAAGVQGSGWGWLGYNKVTGKLEISTTPNQDPLLNHVPLLGVDVWEHAYYLQYKNVRPDYLKAIWEIVNWKNVAERYGKAKALK